jgi:hypothetical protein
MASGSGTSVLGRNSIFTGQSFNTFCLLAVNNPTNGDQQDYIGEYSLRYREDLLSGGFTNYGDIALQVASGRFYGSGFLLPIVFPFSSFSLTYELSVWFKVAGLPYEWRCG